jgi:hypothetical protein
VTCGEGARSEIRRRQNPENGWSRVEALVPGLAWPAVVAAEDGTGWLVFVASAVTERGGVGTEHLTGADAVNESLALQWVHLIASLYAQAVGK